MNRSIARIGTLFLAAVCLFCAVTFAAPIKANAAKPYIVSGVWQFNDTIEMCAYQHIYKNFRSYAFSAGDDPEQFYEFDYIAFADGSMYISPVDDRFTGSGIKVYNNGVWLHDESKKIDFGRNPVSVDETEYMWLIANATYISESPLDGPLIDTVTVLKRQGAFSGVFDQIVSLLPILLVVFIAYVGLRKGIRFVTGFLNRS